MNSYFNINEGFQKKNLGVTPNGTEANATQQDIPAPVKSTDIDIDISSTDSKSLEEIQKELSTISDRAKIRAGLTIEGAEKIEMWLSTLGLFKGFRTMSFGEWKDMYKANTINSLINGAGTNAYFLDERNRLFIRMSSDNDFNITTMLENHIIPEDLCIQAFYGNVVLSNYRGQTIMPQFPHVINGNLTIKNCPMLNSIENFPEKVHREIRVIKSGTPLFREELDKYLKDVFGEKDYYNKVDNDEIIILENMKTKPTLFNNLIDERIKKGNAYLRRLNEGVLNEAFDKCRELGYLMTVDANRRIFAKIKSSLKVEWSEITSANLTMLRGEQAYNQVKNVIVNGKALPSGKDNYGIMIFTDSEDVITCVLAGGRAETDVIYLDEDIYGEFFSRPSIISDTKISMLNDYGLYFGSFPEGENDKTGGKPDPNKPLPLTFYQFLAKIAFMEMCKMYMELPPRDEYDDEKEDPATVTMEKLMSAKMSIFDEGVSFDDALSAMGLSHGVSTRKNRVFIPMYDSGKKASEYTYQIKFPNKENTTNESRDFKNYMDSCKSNETIVDSFIRLFNPELLRIFLRLANTRTLLRTSSGVSFTESDIMNANPGEIYEIALNYADENIRNSLLYNLSLKVDNERGAIGPNTELTQFSQLLLTPDYVSRVYWIKNAGTLYQSALSKLEDRAEALDSIDKAAGAKARKQVEAKKASINFGPKEYYAKLLKGKLNGDNLDEDPVDIFKSASDARMDDFDVRSQRNAIENIRSLRNMRKSGSFSSKADITNALGRLRRKVWDFVTEIRHETVKANISTGINETTADAIKHMSYDELYKVVKDYVTDINTFMSKFEPFYDKYGEVAKNSRGYDFDKRAGIKKVIINRWRLPKFSTALDPDKVWKAITTEAFDGLQFTFSTPSVSGKGHKAISTEDFGISSSRIPLDQEYDIKDFRSSFDSINLKSWLSLIHRSLERSDEIKAVKPLGEFFALAYAANKLSYNPDFTKNIREPKNSSELLNEIRFINSEFYEITKGINALTRGNSAKMLTIFADVMTALDKEPLNLVNDKYEHFKIEGKNEYAAVLKELGISTAKAGLTESYNRYGRPTLCGNMRLK